MQSPALMWMDASFRLQTNSLDQIYPMAIHNGGIVLFIAGYYTIFAATNPRLWDYIVTKPERLKEVGMKGANSMLLYNTETIYKHILHWWILCALDEQCISPKGSSTICEGRQDVLNVRLGKCHRYDQSAINTLLANLYNFDAARYHTRHGNEYVKLHRSREHFSVLQNCSSFKNLSSL